MIQQCKKQMNGKMTEFTVRQKIQCCYWLAELKFPASVQRRFRQEYGQNPPDRHTITKWQGKKTAIEATIETDREAFERSSSKTIHRANARLHIPRSTVRKIVHKRLKLEAYKIELAQKLQPNDKPKWNEFASEMLSCIDEDYDFLNHVAFSDEAIFHTSSKVYHHNCRIWGNENPHVEHERESPKLNIWCCLTSYAVIGPLFFEEPTVTRATYLNMLRDYARRLSLKGTFFSKMGAPSLLQCSQNLSLLDISSMLDRKMRSH